MTINFLDKYMLYKIMEYISDNKTSVNFISTCKYLKDIFYNYGYIKHIKTGNLSDMGKYDFFLMCIKHEKTIDLIEVTNLYNPLCWIPFWPRVVFFNYCTIIKEIKPSKKTKTKVLYLLNNRNNEKINIAWDMFPDLEYLKVDNFNFNMEDVNKCKKLNIKIINK
jgi:hypothetical protein